MDNSFKSLIDSATSIAIVLPTKPYLDQVAAALALYVSLKPTKDITVTSPTPPTVEFSRLIGVDKISADLGNKNLVITFPNYQATNIERVSYDIEEGQFKLSVIPKQGFESPTPEQTKFDYAGGKADLILLVGGANESHFPIVQNEELKDSKFVHIGTRLLEVTSDAQILSFARPASSTSELMGNLIKESESPVDADVATNLLAGIEDGSKNFQSSEVTADTFMMFAQLLNMGGQRIRKASPNDFPQGSVPTQPYNQPVQSGQIQPSTNQQLVEQMVQGQEQPEVDPTQVPKSWTEPKVYTGTTIN